MPTRKVSAAEVKSFRSYPKLPREFYNRPTLEVAPDLLGKLLVFKHPQGIVAGRIVEVEAYIGMDDPACHAAPGLTARNAVMFGKPGVSYIYFIYGMYHCLNVVTEQKGSPAAVLIRALEPVAGEGIMRQLSPGKSGFSLTNGPGKLCRAFGLTREENGLDLTGGRLYLRDSFDKVKHIKRSERIGINVGTERLWRFFDADSPAVSVRNRS